MKNAIAVPFLMLGAGLIAAANCKYSTPAASIAPAGSAKMTPDQPVSETAAGKDAEIASTTPAATAVAEDGFDPTAVVSETTDSGGVDGHALVVAKGDGTHGSGRARVSPAGRSLEEAGSSYQAEPAVGLSISQQMLAACNRLTNCQRVESPALSIAAQRYADYLAATNQQGHYANGSPEQRAAAAGFTGTLLTPGRRGADGWTHYGIGEVLSFGAQDTGGAFNGWLQSPGHRAALMEPSYDVCGFAKAEHAAIYIGMFGNSHAAPAASAMPAARPAVSYCPSGTCGQAIVPLPYQRRGLFGWRR